MQDSQLFRLPGAPAPVEGQLWQHRLPLLQVGFNISLSNCAPTVQRKDGSLLKPGLLVRQGDKLFLVSDILVCGKSLDKVFWSFSRKIETSSVSVDSVAQTCSQQQSITRDAHHKQSKYRGESLRV